MLYIYVFKFLLMAIFLMAIEKAHQPHLVNSFLTV